MPKLKRNVTNAPDKTGFETYDGPEPRAGVYRGIIKSLKLREASTGTMGFNVLVELEARKGSDAAQYDGYPAWVNIWLTDKEGNLAREKQFYRAIGASDTPDIIHDELEDGGKITKIDRKDPLGKVVKVDLKSDTYEGQSRVVGDSVYPIDPAKEKATGKSKAEVEEPDEDDDLLEDDEADEIEEDEEMPDYSSMALPALRKLAREAGLETKGRSAKDLASDLEDTWADAVADEEEPDDEEPDDEEDEEPEGPTVTEARTWKLPQLKKFAREEGGYSAEDLKGLKAADILEMLVDDEVLELGDDEPPF